MSSFIVKKYREFYEKNGYVPKLFNPYNCVEVKDIAPCLSTVCGGGTSSASVLIVEERGKE